MKLIEELYKWLIALKTLKFLKHFVHGNRTVPHSNRVQICLVGLLSRKVVNLEQSSLYMINIMIMHKLNQKHSNICVSGVHMTQFINYS